MMRHFFKQTEGAISIFLAIIMLANFALSAVIVEGARLRMAQEIIQSAADSAAMSVIAKYDKELYDRYGLFAMENVDEQVIYNDFKTYFLANISSALPDGDAFDELFSKLEAQYGLSKDIKPFNLYDFQLESGNITPIYSIGNPTILQLQTTEFAKYRAVTRVMQDLSDLGTNISGNAEQQQKDVQTIQNSLEYKEQMSDVSEKLAQFTVELSDFYMGEHSDATIGTVEKSSSIEPTELNRQLNEKYTAINGKIDEINSTLSSAQTSYNTLKEKITEYNTLKTQIANAEQKLREEYNNIEFNSSNEKYDESMVQQWNKDKDNINNLVSNLKSLKTGEGGIDSLVAAYTSSVNALPNLKTELVNQCSGLIELLNGWKTKLEGFRTEFTELAGEAETACQTANEYKNSGIKGDGEVATTATEEANKNIEEIKKSMPKDSSGRYLGEVYLNNSIEDIAGAGKMLDKANDLYNYCNNLQFNNIGAINITYAESEGTPEALETKAAEKKKQYAESHENDSSESENILIGRPEWNKLSNINQINGDGPSTAPDDAIQQAASRLNAIKTLKIRGKFYVYKCSIEKLDNEKYNDLNNKAGGVLDKEDLKEKFKDDGNASTGVGSEKNADSVGIGNGKIELDGLPSHNRSSFAIDSQTISNNSKSSNELSSFNELEIGKDKESQNQSYSAMDSFLEKIKNWFVGAQYDVVTYSYIMSMFNTRMTKASEFVQTEGGVAKTTKEGNKTIAVKGSSELVNDSGKDEKWYVNRNPNDDLDLMFRTKSSNKTALNSELEYLIMGQSTDVSNTNRVWGTIFGIRMVNNLIAIYTEPTIKSTVSSLSAEIAAAIGAVTFGAGTLLAPLIELAIMAILASVETYLDMEYLVTKGYKVPFLKTKKNLNLTDTSPDNRPNYTNSDFMVSYEDYLLVMLIFAGKENVLFRTADLIQMNMGDGYNLLNKKTYVKCNNTVSIKPFMISYGFMPDNLKSDERRTFTTTLYQGY